MSVSSNSNKASACRIGTIRKRSKHFDCGLFAKPTNVAPFFEAALLVDADVGGDDLTRVEMVVNPLRRLRAGASRGTNARRLDVNRIRNAYRQSRAAASTSSAVGQREGDKGRSIGDDEAEGPRHRRACFPQQAPQQGAASLPSLAARAFHRGDRGAKPDLTQTSQHLDIVGKAAPAQLEPGNPAGCVVLQEPVAFPAS